MSFFVLVNPEVGDNDAVTDFDYARDRKFGEAMICPSCHQPITLREWLPPFRVKMRCWGKLYGDIAFNIDDILVSERFMTLYRNEDLAGLTFIGEAEVIKVVPKRFSIGSQRYFVARPVHSRAIVDHESSGSEFESSSICPDCLVGNNLLRRRRIVIGDNTWSGEDNFVPRGLPGVHLTSERFKEFCEKYRITNVKLEDALDCSLDWHPQDK